MNCSLRAKSCRALGALQPLPHRSTGGGDPKALPDPVRKREIRSEAEGKRKSEPQAPLESRLRAPPAWPLRWSVPAKSGPRPSAVASRRWLQPEPPPTSNNLKQYGPLRSGPACEDSIELSGPSIRSGEVGPLARRAEASRKAAAAWEAAGDSPYVAGHILHYTINNIFYYANIVLYYIFYIRLYYILYSLWR